MQFSTFQKNLDNWQGASLIFGVLEEEIASQLENIKFVVDPKLLLKKVTQKKFKGEKGKTLSFEFLDQKLETLIIVGLGKSKDLHKSDIENSIGNLIRKTVDKNEKIDSIASPLFVPYLRDFRSIRFGKCPVTLRVYLDGGGDNGSLVNPMFYRLNFQLREGLLLVRHAG